MFGNRNFMIDKFHCFLLRWEQVFFKSFFFLCFFNLDILVYYIINEYCYDLL